MSESQQLQQVRDMIAAGDGAHAKPVLLQLFNSADPAIRLDTALLLLAVLDPLTERADLLTVAAEGIAVADTLGRADIHAYLLAKKASLLLNELGHMIYRQRSLMLAAGAFDWIAFSLEKDQREHESLADKRKELEAVIDGLESQALETAAKSGNRYFRGHVFTELAEIHFARFLNEQLDLAAGGRFRSMVANSYYVRRWGLDKLLIHSQAERIRLRRHKAKCMEFYERAFDEFRADNLSGDLGYALYNRALKLSLTFSFAKAKQFVRQAKEIATQNDDALLLSGLEHLERQIKDKNKHLRD
jgi:hypothetical protein